LEIRRSADSLLQTIWFSLNQLATIRGKIVSLKPDVVVSFVDQTNVRTACSLVGTGIRVIVSERIHPAYNPTTPAWLAARRLAYPMADIVTVQTESGAEWFRRQTRVRRLIVIPNAVRYPQDLQIDAAELATSVSRPLILAMGRLARQKGFDFLLEAFYRSRLMENGWHLAILGEGDAHATLELQAAALGITEALTLPGHVSQIGRWLASAGIFVLSSRYEGFPNALLEAMQMGKACISFDCPSGPRDLVEHDRNGLLVTPEDVQGLSEALQRLAADPDLRKRLGANASDVNRQFSPTSVYGQWLSLVDAVASGNTASLISHSIPRAPISAG
jgi:glycosyltransferase involved in cell wall biosynthesis